MNAVFARGWIAVGVFFSVFFLVFGGRAQAASRADLRAQATQQLGGANQKAYDTFRSLLLAPAEEPDRAAEDFNNAAQALSNLYQRQKLDDLRMAAVKAHPDNWRLLEAVAKSILYGEHQGRMLGVKFTRSYNGAGRFVGTSERDRIQALAWMQQAMPFAAADPDRFQAARFFLNFADMMLWNNYSEQYWQGAIFLSSGFPSWNGCSGRSWQLQSLSDLSKLPDYEESQSPWYFYANYPQSMGAPQNADGAPVYYSIPNSWEAARSDGERWRWLLNAASVGGPDSSESLEAAYHFAMFLASQFDVQTVGSSYGMRLAQLRISDAGAGPYDVRTLTDTETIAQLASGIQRFTLPEEFNYIHILARVAKSQTGPNSQALDGLAQIYLNRQDYDQAAACCREAIHRFGAGNDRQGMLSQIEDGYGRFSPSTPQPAGKPARVELSFRNASNVEFEARPIRVDAIIRQVKADLKSNKQRLDWQDRSVGDLGDRLGRRHQLQYLDPVCASWKVKLDPLPHHFDRTITITTPLIKPGFYWLTGHIGNTTCQIVVNISDITLVQKPMAGKLFCIVVDSATGKPIPGAKVDLFSYTERQTRVNHFERTTSESHYTTNSQGQVIAPRPTVSLYQQGQFLSAQGPHGGLAYLDFGGFYSGGSSTPNSSASGKGFAATSQPVYRPGQTVRFKCWAEKPVFGKEGPSDYKGMAFRVIVRDPRSNTQFEKILTADEYGGFGGSFKLAEDAALGRYSLLALVKNDCVVYSSFSVEEYKKPEFEVKIDAPAKPITLGGKVEATISARYYFGEPVKQGTVHYSVTRSASNQAWWPTDPWDWMYGPGYWWCGSSRNWYTGWRGWADWARPSYSYGRYYYQGGGQSEVIADGNVPLNADGTFRLSIDTGAAKALFGDVDQKYTITAEVTDSSRRMVSATGTVTAAARPFRVYVWTNRGYYHPGDPLVVSVSARTADGKPVQSTGTLRILHITYRTGQKSLETAISTQQVELDADGSATLRLAAPSQGQYRLSCTIREPDTDIGKEALPLPGSIEGAEIMTVIGPAGTDSDLRFNPLELTPDKKRYQVGDTIHLLVSANRPGSTVLLFVRPSYQSYPKPQILHLTGRTAVVDIPVQTGDMPSLFVEADTVDQAHLYTEIRKIAVPPENRLLTVHLKSSATEYKPGAKATLSLTAANAAGYRVPASVLISVYDRSLEYISGGSNTGDIRSTFWGMSRYFYPSSSTNLTWMCQSTAPQHEDAMAPLGIFGYLPNGSNGAPMNGPSGMGHGNGFDNYDGPVAFRSATVTKMAAPTSMAAAMAPGMPMAAPLSPAPVAPPLTIRSAFADTAFWMPDLELNKNGEGTATFTLPENLTAWKTRVWVMGSGCRVGMADTDFTTRKNLIVRLEAPRFFTQTDRVTLSAIVHNYLKTTETVKVAITDADKCLTVDGDPQTITVQPGGEQRVDFTAHAVEPGSTSITASAIGQDDSDAVRMTFPVQIHGMLKTDSFAGTVKPDQTATEFTVNVPVDRVPRSTRLEVTAAPSVAASVADALPYLVYGPLDTTEGTLNRFLPTLMVHRMLVGMNTDLDAVRREVNKQRAEMARLSKNQWGSAEGGDPAMPDYNPVFSDDRVTALVRKNIKQLAAMQLSDGGWGWFSGYGEESYPDTTALVVYGLDLASNNGAEVDPNRLERGNQWLAAYASEQVTLIENFEKQVVPSKEFADDTDALVTRVMTFKGPGNAQLLNFLYRDRQHLSVYGRILLGLALSQTSEKYRLNSVLENLNDYLEVNAETDTASLRMPTDGWWWWYNQGIEANAAYLQLLCRVDPKGEKTAQLARYLINNRKHATYWNNTRDTALCVEALTDYLHASGEAASTTTIRLLVDGKLKKTVRIGPANLFTSAATIVVPYTDLPAGNHTVRIEKTGNGRVYYDAQLTNFTLESQIPAAGLYIKTTRRYYKLTPRLASATEPGSHGQVVDEKVQAYDRTEVTSPADLKSGDLVEVEIEIQADNDYEYVQIDDPKPAGFEALEVRSGYRWDDLGSYMELHDNRVSFFVRRMSKGGHTLRYRVRCEVPGQFSALPTRAMGVYAPDLRANSAEAKVNISD